MASASSNDYDDKKRSNNNNNGFRSGFLGKTGTDEAPLDKTYYNILNVSPTASSTEIKKAYYSLSLQYHPDRTQNLDDYTRREYAERFKLISQAYTILSDPEKRTLYNRYGKDERIVSNGTDGISVEDFDAEEFFRMMFGGEQFADIIGDFEIAKSFKHVVADLLKETDLTREQQEQRRQERIIEAQTAREARVQDLSVILISRLSVFTDEFESNNHEIHTGDALNRFIEIMRMQLPNLLEAPYGEQLLHSIGYIYSSKAQFWLSKMDSQEGHFGKRFVGSCKHFKSKWNARAHVFKETVKTVKCAVQLGQSMSKLAQAAEQEAINSENDNDSQYPFQHHSGHLEYSGYIPPESTASASPSSSTPPPTYSHTTSTPPPTHSHTTSTPPGRQRLQRKTSAQPVVPLTEEEKRRLEADMAAKSMETLWRATKLEIESIERDVCDKILNDSTCSRDIRRRRCLALSKLGELWQQASSSSS